MPVTEPQPPLAPAVDPSKVPAPPDRAAIGLDRCWHGILAPRQAAPPAGSAYVGSLAVRFEPIGDTESHWIHPAVDGAGPCQLRGTLEILGEGGICCASLEPPGAVTAAEAGDTLLRALWQARFAPAMALDGSPRGRGTENYDNGRIWFDGIFGRQTCCYGCRARVWVRGRHCDRDGSLLYEGRFTTSERHSKPLLERWRLCRSRHARKPQPMRRNRGEK